MCGIIAQVKRKDDGVRTNSNILGMFQQQISRGTEGFGFVSFNETVNAYIRRSKKEEIENAVLKDNARSFLFHHRIPTSTPNYADTTHPIKVTHEELSYDYFVIHNGIISNDTLLHEQHVALGYEYMTTVLEEIRTANSKISHESYNDSEAFAIDLVRFIEGKQEKMKSRGSIAFIALQVDKKNNKVVRVFWGRNGGNPLSILLTKDQLILRSLGETTEVKENVLYSLTLKTWKTEESDVSIGEYATSRKYDYGDYRRTSMGFQQSHEQYGGYNDDEWDGSSDRNYSKNDNAYGLRDDEDEGVVSQFVENKIKFIEERIDELYEENNQLLEDVSYAKANKDEDNVSKIRQNIAKNLERINTLEIEIEMLQTGIEDVTS